MRRNNSRRRSVSDKPGDSDAFTMARALARGNRMVLAQSSGNTANALARYADHVGIGCVILYPPASRRRLLPELGGVPGIEFVEVDARGNVARDAGYATSVPGVFVAGDMGRGQSLIVWAIAEGRAAAAAIHRYLGSPGALPSPVDPAAVPLAAS